MANSVVAIAVIKVHFRDTVTYDNVSREERSSRVRSAIVLTQSESCILGANEKTSGSPADDERWSQLDSCVEGEEWKASITTGKCNLRTGEEKQQHVEITRRQYGRVTPSSSSSSDLAKSGDCAEYARDAATVAGASFVSPGNDLKCISRYHTARYEMYLASRGIVSTSLPCPRPSQRENEWMVTEWSYWS